jgi:hypothetical protein
MTTRAKFRCNSVNHVESTKPGPDGKWVPCEAATITMSPVYANGDPKHENSKFWNATPSGQFTMNVVNLEAAELFQPGKEYYIDISPAD